MAKGCCGGSGCACKISGSGKVSVSGSGSADDPFVIDTDISIVGGHNQTFDTTIAGNGNNDDPWIISTTFAPTARLDDLPDVNTPVPTNGYVLAWSAATQKWVPQAPTTAAAGAVTHDNSMSGDGSVGLPLAVAPVTARYIATFTGGVGINDAGLLSMVRHFASAADRTAGIPIPAINQLTMLDTNPGIVWYWTGSIWAAVPTQTQWAALNGQFMMLSGPYTAGLPITIMTSQIATTTDSQGVFDVLLATDLTARSGILGIWFQETGAQAWSAVLYPNVDHVSATGYRLTDGSVLAGTPITGTATAVLY
jgi:hypothetical protein